jgi:hypothetical protein
MKTILKIVVGIIVAVIILVVGVVALIGGAANEVAKDIEGDHAKGAEYAMSAAEFKAVDTAANMTYKEFVAEYGKPDPEQTQEQQVDGTKFLTVYYNVEGGDLMDMYQFSFTDGVLDAKSKF